MTTELNGVEIRPVTSDDTDALLAFIEPYVVEGKLIPRTTDEIPDLLRNGFVATDGGRIIGFAALEIYSRKLGEIRSLAVAEEYRRHGIGGRLVELCLERARQHSLLEVMAITSSDRFFMEHGFDFTLPGEKKALFIQP